MTTSDGAHSRSLRAHFQATPLHARTTWPTRLCRVPDDELAGTLSGWLARDSGGRLEALRQGDKFGLTEGFYHHSLTGLAGGLVACGFQQHEDAVSFQQQQ